MLRGCQVKAQRPLIFLAFAPVPQQGKETAAQGAATKTACPACYATDMWTPPHDGHCLLHRHALDRVHPSGTLSRQGT